jgi:hypothetical protein
MTDIGWSKQAIAYMPEQLSDLYQELRALALINFTDWTDDSIADPGNALLWLAAILQKLGLDYVNRAVLNSYIETAFQRYEMQRLLTLIGYELSNATAAAVTVTFTLENGHPQFTIPVGTQVGTEETTGSDQIIFETSEDRLVQESDDSVDIICTQGETISAENLSSSDGTADQRFKLANPSVLFESETIEINDGGWTEWTRVTDFIDSESDDNHYRVETDSQGYSYIVFGDGTNGAIPAAGSNNIRCTYRIGGGIAGNIGAGKIIELISNIDYVESVENAAAASGGTAEETLEHARKFGPPSLRTLDRGVTESDFKYLTEQFYSSQYGGIAKAVAKEVALSMQVRIIPKAGGAPSQGLKDALLEYLNEKRMACMPVEVLDPAYKTIDITVNIYLYDNYVQDTVVDTVASALRNHLSPTYQDENGLYPHEFGADVRLSDLYHVIDAIDGVDYCDISVPSSNVTVADHEIAKLGTLNITAHQGGQSQSYLDI